MSWELENKASCMCSFSFTIISDLRHRWNKALFHLNSSTSVQRTIWLALVISCVYWYVLFVDSGQVTRYSEYQNKQPRAHKSKYATEANFLLEKSRFHDLYTVSKNCMCLLGNGAANLCHGQVTILYDEQKADDFLCVCSCSPGERRAGRPLKLQNVFQNSLSLVSELD